MEKHALVLASQTGRLLGANLDATRMSEHLSTRGFKVDLRTGTDATRAGILDGYAQLIAKVKAGDAAVVYYSGHGSYEIIPEQIQISGPFTQKRYQALVPFDYEHSSESDFRGILAEEMSILLYKLTLKTPNAAVILDCCHSALMSRDLRVVPKALPHPIYVGVEDCIRNIIKNEDPQIVHAALMPKGSDAVRLVACRQEQSAYEHSGPDGKDCGVFTEGLLAALAEAGKEPVTFRDIAQRAAEYVLLRFAGQLPGVEGRADRKLFELDEQRRPDTAPISETLKGWVVRRGRVFGVKPGDVYSILPPAGTPNAEKEIGRATVIQVDALESEVSITPDPSMTPIPEGARGMPIEWAEAPRLVCVPANSEHRNEIIQAIMTNPRLSPTESAEQPVVATVYARNGKLSLLNREELPMVEELPLSDATLEKLSQNLKRMAQACALRELQGEGILGVNPEDLDVEWGLVINGETSPLPLSGALIGPGDGIYTRLKNRGERKLYVHIFDIDIADEVTPLTGEIWPTGVQLEPGTEELLFRHRQTHKLMPSIFSWPSTVPAEQGLRQNEILIIATKAPADLTALGQEGVTRHGGAPKAESKIRQLMAQAIHGKTRRLSTFGAGQEDGLLTKRIMFFGCPWPASRAEGGGGFLIDEQRSALDIIAQPKRGAKPPPQKIAVLINDLIVHKNRAVFGADIRVDALFVTPRAKSDGQSYHTGTLRFPKVKDGDRLPLDQLLVYMGPAKDFLQVCLWVSRDTKESMELSDMLKTTAASQEVQGALTTLAALAVAAPQAAIIAGAVGAAVTLADASYKLLSKAVGHSIGVYRTSLLAADGFRAGRHPSQGHIRAQDFSFSFEVRVIS